MLIDIITKTAEPLRIAEACASAPGFGHDNLAPVFERLLPEVAAVVARAGATPGMTVAWYEEPSDDGAVVVHAGFEIADQAVDSDDGVRVVALPAIEVASTIHKGSMDGIESIYEALVSWVEQSGFRLAGRSRELYHHWEADNPSGSVTELQMPISR